MAIMAMDTRTKKALILLFLTSITFSGYSGEWDLKPSVRLDETYSDNLQLSQANEKSGVVSQTGIDFSANYKAQNSSLDLKSTSTYAWYSHNHDLNSDYYTLSANGRVLLWPNGLTFTSSASISNQAKNSSINALGDIVSADVTQVEQYQAGLEYAFSNSKYSLNSALQYQTSSSQDNIGENEGVNFSLSSTNGAAARNIFWNTSGNYSERKNNGRDTQQHAAEIKVGWITGYKFSPFVRFYDEDNTGNVNSNNSLKTNSYGLGFRWEPIPRLNIDLSYNEPIEDSLDGNGEEQDAYIDASIIWQPTSRTQIQASHSQRFFGDSYGLNITHKNKKLSNTISYNEQVRSFTRDNYQVVTSSFLCQNPDATSLSDCFLQDGDVFSPEDSSLITVDTLELVDDNDYWLNKNWRWTSTLNLSRTSFTLNANYSDRENLNTGQINDTKAAGFTARRDLGPKTSLSLSANYNERGYEQTDSNQKDIYRRYQLKWDRKLNNKLNFDFSIQHYNRSSNQEQYNYEENRVSAKITKDF